MRRFTVLVVLVLAASFSLFGQSSHADLDKLVDETFDSIYKFNPSSATADGFHQYDTQLEDLSKASVAAEVAACKSSLAKLQAFPRAGLNESSSGDLDFFISRLHSRLLELETIQMWRRDPDIYTSTATNSIFLLMSRKFASEDERLRLTVAREKLIPNLLEEAQKNLSDVPRVYTEVAIEDLANTPSFFQNDVPTAFSSVKDAKLLAQFHDSNAAVITAFKKYETFLKEKLLPVSNGDFRLGADNFQKKLSYDEMVDIPLDRLLEIGYGDLRRNQQRVREVAALIDPKKSPREVMQNLQKDHPAAGQVLTTFRNTLGGLKKFIEEKQIITIPSDVLPIVEDTPPFERALTSASMDTPGAYEKVAKEAYFNVTPVEKTWSPQRAEQWLQAYNRGTIVSTAVHEVYPGHYTQFLWIQAAPSKVRKLIYCSSNAEGWAHYTEQVMLDEGYGNSDPKLRLGQLLDALLRDSRYISGIEMHTGKMTLAQSRQFFIDEGYQTPATADQESKRGTSDPTYLYYTLGKLQILKLREDYKAMKGDKFSLKEFHNEFMRQGAVPVKIIRKTMLGNDSPTL